MKWCIIIFGLLSFATTATLATSLSKSGCQEKCGKITIPYPFGIGRKCSANSSFTVECINSTTLILSSIKMEALNISILGTVVVKQLVSPMNCSDQLSSGNLYTSLKGTPFTISAHYNTLVVYGCKNSVWLGANETSTLGVCSALCNNHSSENSCNGVNCCKISIPRGLKELHYTYRTNEGTGNNGVCGYVFAADKERLQKDYRSYKRRQLEFSPLVLEWEYGELKGYTNPECTYSDDYCLSIPDESGSRYRSSFSDSCESRNFNDYCHIYPDYYSPCGSQNQISKEYNLHFSNYYKRFAPYTDYVSTTKYCSCPSGYEGSPYLPGGCLDVDECKLSKDPCGTMTCINLKGSNICEETDMDRKDRVTIAVLSYGSAIGALILLLAAWKMAKFIRKRIKANRRRKFFKQNGGLLLEQQLSATDNSLEKTKLFSSKELAQATGQYSENRILGRGGQGTVYKGMLPDGKIVAVKKSKKLEEGDLEDFINEVVILSQVNHRNIVKLLGCCLETEVPLLVYEFISNGTLIQHIHEPSDEFPLTWAMRLRIAKHVAGAIAYLHSAASAPIFHRDIKSTNILLDDKYRAKVSDFGTSRSVTLEQTHVTTRVLGTFGYLDPEYFQSNQFTEKSDVYSFGVVMVELLTGEKAVSIIEEVGRSLASHFLQSMEENKLLDILDARVLNEGQREEIEVIADLARRCLQLNGRRRPTMKEVAAELEAIKEVEERPNVVQGGDGCRESHSIDVDVDVDESLNSFSFSDSSPISTGN